MSDLFSKRERSRIMRSIRGRGNRSTEERLRYRLVSVGFSGWCLHDEEIAGRPDFAFPRAKLAVFVDGCFWHGCRRCRTIPRTNHEFWDRKIRNNKKRDRMVATALRRKGWRLLRFWEHEVQRNPDQCLWKIGFAIKKSQMLRVKASVQARCAE